MRKHFLIAAALLTISASPAAYAQDTTTGADVQDRYFARVEQVATAAWPLLVSGADLCQVDTAYRTGLRAGYASDSPDGQDGARVIAVAKGSPADVAGVKRGDSIVAINGEKVEGMIPGRGEGRLTKLIDEAAESESTVEFELTRGGQAVTATVTPSLVCDLKVEYLPVQSMLAPRSGDTVIVSELLFNVADSDWQRQAFLATDLAYAMSQTAKRNSLIQRAAGFGGNFLGAVSGINGLATAVNLGSSLALNKDQALKADRVSLYLLARAGVDVSLVPDFWRSVYDYPESAKWSKTYFGLRPTLAERNEVFAKTVDEIKALQASGKPLTPSGT